MQVTVPEAHGNLRKSLMSKKVNLEDLVRILDNYAMLDSVDQAHGRGWDLGECTDHLSDTPSMVETYGAFLSMGDSAQKSVLESLGVTGSKVDDLDREMQTLLLSRDDWEVSVAAELRNFQRTRGAGEDAKKEKKLKKKGVMAGKKGKAAAGMFADFSKSRKSHRSMSRKVRNMNVFSLVHT